jgi:endoglucanase
MGGGPALSRGSAVSPMVFDMLIATAEREGIPFSLEASPRYTGTDADAIHYSRGGVAAGLVSIPNRYMHSPNEMIQLSDVENAAKLIAAFVKTLSSESRFIPE